MFVRGAPPQLGGSTIVATQKKLVAMITLMEPVNVSAQFPQRREVGIDISQHGLFLLALTSSTS